MSAPPIDQVVAADNLRANLRFAEVDGRKLFSVYDMMRIVLPNRSDASRWQTFNRIKASSETEDAFVMHCLPGGNRTTPLCQFHTLLWVVTKLPGPLANSFCQHGMVALARAFAGNIKLAAQIEETNRQLAGTQEESVPDATAAPPRPSAVIQVLTREDSSRVAEARMAAIRDAAKQEIEAKRLDNLAKGRKIALDAEGAPAWYKHECQRRCSALLRDVDMAAQALLNDMTTKPPKKAKTTVDEESSKRPSLEVPLATDAQRKYWVPSDDGMYLFPTNNARAEYERLTAYPCELSMTIAALAAGGVEV